MGAPVARAAASAAAPRAAGATPAAGGAGSRPAAKKAAPRKAAPPAAPDVVDPVDEPDVAGGRGESTDRGRQLVDTLTRPNPGRAINAGAAFILAIAGWCLVGLPFLKDGVSGVKAQLMAKFLNKAPDGSWLP